MRLMSLLLTHLQINAPMEDVSRLPQCQGSLKPPGPIVFSPAILCELSGLQLGLLFDKTRANICFLFIL